MVVLAAVTTAYKWFQALHPATVVYTKRNCTVLNTTVDVWGHDRSICLPKVQVDIQGDLRKDFSGETWAFKFLQQHSDSWSTIYEPDCAGWLNQFRIDSVVDCWQAVYNPETVKLDESNYSRTWSAYIDALIPTGFLAFFAVGFFCDACGAALQPDKGRSRLLSASETTSEA